LWGYGFFGVIDLLTFASGPEFHLALILETGWGLLFLVLVAGPCFCLVFRPESAAWAAVAQISAVALAVAIAAALSLYPRALFVAAGLTASAVLIAAVSGTSWLIRPGWRPAAAPSLLVAIAAGPCAAYAYVSASNTGSDKISDITLQIDHWPIQAAFALAALFSAAIGAGHPRGWAISMWSVLASAAWFAAISWEEPDLEGSIGRGWSTALIGWAISFLLATCLTAHPARRRGQSPD
jgi:hypothetical protein